LATQVTDAIAPLLAEDVWSEGIHGGDGWVSAPVALEVLQPAIGAVIGSAGAAGAAAAAARRPWAVASMPAFSEDSPAPCGGQGSSGNGSHFGGVATLEGFTEWQWRTSRPVATPFTF
jgi:hypothetical protein